VTKSWGCFMHADDVTSKKLTMDVTRILIQTSCHKAVDEFIDVKVNGEIFHLRVIEDSYGPIRIMIPPQQGQDGRAIGGDSSEDEEEVERRLWAEEEDMVMERESEEEGDNLLALKSIVNVNNVPLIDFDRSVDLNKDREGLKENSNISTNLKPNFNAKNLNSKDGCTVLVGGVIDEDNYNVNGGNLMGQVV
ncbi:hypothetical protein L195_g054801, partial [Trifolium pratense]